MRLLPATLITTQLCLAFWWWLGRPLPLAEADVPPGVRLQCASYAPFAEGESPADISPQHPVPAARIERDLRLLAERFDCVRTYSVLGLEAVPAVAQQLGMKLLLGAWVNGDATNSRREIETLVALAKAYPETVSAVVVGNEVLLRGELKGAQLAAYLHEVKGRVAQPVTYADVWEFVLRDEHVLAAVEFVTIHILPYWEDEPVAIDEAIAHVARIRAEVAAQLPGREILIGETGWPSRGRMREGALPSPRNQARFVRGLAAAAERGGWRYNLVEALDQPWKRGQEGTVGGYWGVYDSTRHDKGAFAGAVSNHPAWPWLALFGAAVALGLLLTTPATPLVVMVAAAAGCALALQAEQFIYAARSLWEQLWAVAVLMFAFAATASGLRGVNAPTAPAPFEIALMRLRRGRFGNGLWHPLLLAAAAVFAIGLALDPRYRSFPTAAFIIPALLFAQNALRVRPAGAGHDFREEAALGVLLVLCAGLTLLHETLRNIEALAWVATLLLLALAPLRFWLGAQRPQQRQDKTEGREAGIVEQ